jgi:hypothetical protein
MIQIIQNIENLNTQLLPPALLSIGILTLIAGLIIWLGGLGVRKLLVAIVGIIAGITTAYLITGQQLRYILLAAGIGIIAGILLEKQLTIVVPAILAAICAFIILAHFQKADLSVGIRFATAEIPLYSWAIIAAAAIAALFAAIYLRRTTWAISCAVFGSGVIFTAMIILLTCKGISPTEKIAEKPYIYTAAFAAMCLFGTIEQLLLCREKHDKNGDETESKDKKEDKKEKPKIWRTS